MVELNLDQSLCGETEKKSYGLLKTTIQDTEEAKVLANKSDLPDHTQGIKFNPALRGFAEGKYFLILKTFRDTSPDVRPNRVFTHMLSAPAKELCHFNNLRSICDVLQNHPSKNSQLSRVTIKQNLTHNHVEEGLKARFNKLIHGYINRLEFFNTIVWIGQESYEDAVCELWARISPSERASVNLGIYFGTENLTNGKVNIICVPESVQSKFLKKGYFVIGPNDTHKLVELSELILAGDPVAIKRVNDFCSALGITNFKRTQVDAIVAGIKTFETFEQVNDLKKVNTLSHIVATYSPDPKVAVVLKDMIVRRLANLIEKAENTDFIILRHFKTESFAESKKSLSKAVTSWLDNMFFKPLQRKATNLTPIFGLLSEKDNWLSETFLKRLKLFLSNLDQNKVKIIYQWLASFSGTLESCKKYLPLEDRSEELFIELLPHSLGPGLIKMMKEFALDVGWFRLHAHLLIASTTSMEKALQTQLIVDKNYRDDRGVRILAKKFSVQAIFDFTLSNPDIRLVNFCGHLCIEKPLLLNKIDVNKYAWQLIWIAAIDYGRPLKESLKNAQGVVFKVFDLMIEKREVAPRLIDLIADSQFADLREYKNLSKLWTFLSPTNRDKILRVTSSNLLGALAKNPSTIVPDDPVLSDFIFQHGISVFLYYNKDNISSTLPIFSKYAHLKENVLCDYLNNYNGDISQKEAKSLGKMILKKKFLNATEIVFRRTRKNNNWRFALSECHSQMGVIAKAIIFIGQYVSKVRIPSDEWWDAISDIIIDLYANPTSLGTIWKKSGGKEYDLLNKGSTKEIWLDALHRLRHKAIKHITMNDLLTEINKDYKDHDDFQTLYEIRGQFIKTK